MLIHLMRKGPTSIYPLYISWPEKRCRIGFAFWFALQNTKLCLNNYCWRNTRKFKQKTWQEQARPNTGISVRWWRLRPGYRIYERCCGDKSAGKALALQAWGPEFQGTEKLWTHIHTQTRIYTPRNHKNEMKENHSWQPDFPLGYLSPLLPCLAPPLTYSKSDLFIKVN